MERLRQARPAACEPPVQAPHPWFRRLLVPTFAAAAAIALAAILFHQSASTPTSVAGQPSPATKASPEVSVTHSRRWLSARELGSGIGEDGQPYRVVEGRWLDLSQLRIDGRPDVWTTATPGEGVACVAMAVY